MKKIYEKYIKRCITLAKKAGGDTLPNPLVGCVIVKNDKIIGEGYHKKFGFPHAEVEAINSSRESVKGATLFVNLEPCSHYGKTPPCVDLIISKKIKKVVIGMQDPNPLVAGKGIEKLKNAGIEVVTGILDDKCKELNEVFIKNIIKKKTFISLKLAATLDGKIAEPSGYSKWITNEKSRKYVHKLRLFCDGILVGAETIRKDNPNLNVRKNNKIIKELKKIILTNSFNLDENFNIFKDADNLYFLTQSNKIPKKFLKYNILKFKNFIEIPELLYKNNIFNILVEGGSKISYSFIKSNIIDKFYFFYSNKIMGGKDTISMINGNDFFPLKKPFKINIKYLKKLDNNFLVIGYNDLSL